MSTYDTCYMHVYIAYIYLWTPGSVSRSGGEMRSKRCDTNCYSLNIQIIEKWRIEKYFLIHSLQFLHAYQTYIFYMYAYIWYIYIWDAECHTQNVSFSHQKMRFLNVNHFLKHFFDTQKDGKSWTSKPIQENGNTFQIINFVTCFLICIKRRYQNGFLLHFGSGLIERRRATN